MLLCVKLNDALAPFITEQRQLWAYLHVLQCVCEMLQSEGELQVIGQVE